MKIAALISGGVDSSVALNILKNEGHDLTAYYLKVWLEDELAFLGECPWEADLKFVRAVCDQLDVPLEVISLQSEYLERVVSYALDELRAGRTPSPDIFCNQRIKFGAFFDHIDSSYEKVATGHYAQIAQSNGTYHLKRAPDPVKDQTYFLSGMYQSQVARALFPIGNMMKSKVRQLARDFDLPNQARKDSQGICFLGKIRYPDFIAFHLGEKKRRYYRQRNRTNPGTSSGLLLLHNRTAVWPGIGRRTLVRRAKRYRTQHHLCIPRHEAQEYIAEPLYRDKSQLDSRTT